LGNKIKLHIDLSNEIHDTYTTASITRVADGEHVTQVAFSSFYHYFNSNQNK